MHLNDFIDVYLPKYKNDDGFIMASHVERLKQSECFKNSDMTCINCHNPHKSIRMLNDKYFDKKREMMPPDIDRDPNKTYNTVNKYNLANPID